MNDDREPAWLDAIRSRIAQSRPSDHDPSLDSVLRPAAVLVLLIDSNDGPNVLLTQRAATLTNYPRSLVFPGGSTETNDEGPTATALREAAEEIGIDPTQVHIIGSLAPLPLRETGFLVTPVVGWCTRLQPSDTPNPEEVTVEVQIPLREFADTSDRVQRSPLANTTDFQFSIDGTAVGEMTSIVIDALLDHRQRLPLRRSVAR